MHAERQIVSSSPSGTAARRLLAACCLLVLVLCSVLQATHLHNAPHAGTTHSGYKWLQASGGSDTESTCPLCVSGDSALTVRPATWFRVVLSFGFAGPNYNGRLVPTRVPFTQCTRPPPCQPVQEHVFAGSAKNRNLPMRLNLEHQVFPGIRTL